MKKVLYFLASVVPFLAMVLLIVVTTLVAVNMTYSDAAFYLLVSMFLIGTFVTAVLTYGVAAFFVVKTWKGDLVPANKRPLWSIMLCGFTVLAFPFFWTFYLRKEK